MKILPTPPKWKLCMIWNWFIAKFISIFQNYVLKLFKMVANQIASGLNKVLSWNFWWLRSANSVKFTEECGMCIEKHVLVNKKNVYKWAKHEVCHYESELKRLFIDSLVKKKFQAHWSEDHGESYLGHKRTDHYWFLCKRCYCKQFFLLPTP